jgi:peptide/nickel transport system substrate-binding protein
MRIAGMGVATAVAAMLVAAGAQAGKKDDTLNWLTEFEPPTYDFYAQTNREGVIIGQHVWDALVVQNLKTGEYKPHLAKSVTYSNPTTLEVVLKEGIKFHNGQPLTAEDVVYTIQWQLDPENKKNASPSRTNWIERAEKTGDYTLRLHLKKPFAPAMDYLAQNVPIYPHEHIKKVGSDGMSKQPIGTGPYKVKEVVPGKHFIMEKNPDYFGGEKGKPIIGKIVMRIVPERNTQIAELMAGNADLIWRLPLDQAQKLKGQRGITVLDGDTMRFGYLQFDVTGRPGKSPIDDVRVRKAMAHAIDREGIVKNLLGGGQVLHLPCYVSQIGCIAEPEAAKYPHDPAKAKALLAEAGLANGFEIEFHGYRDRQVAEAIIGDLAKVGIKAKLVWMQYPALRDKVRKGEVLFNFMTWGSGSINDAHASVGYFFLDGADDTAKDKDLIAWLKSAEEELDTGKRKTLYAKANTKIVNQVYMIPTWSYAYFYAMSDQLEFTPTPDEIPHLYRSSWKK